MASIASRIMASVFPPEGGLSSIRQVSHRDRPPGQRPPRRHDARSGHAWSGRRQAGQEATGSVFLSLSLLIGSAVTERRLEMMIAATTTPTASTVMTMRTAGLPA
jgi:hypothetical protein